MLFWTKLLTAAHAATTSIHPYLCLYYFHRLRFGFLTISMLTACVMLLKVPASAFWADLVDHRPTLHGVFTALLTTVGTAAILLVLSVPPTWITITLPVAIFSSILDGLFYQPLEVLVDSAIIKILGDYKIMYVHERQYGKMISAIMAVGIGWSLDDDHDFDTLMVTILIGSVFLFLLSLSTTVQPADPCLLGIAAAVYQQDLDERSPLVKHTLQPTDTSSSYVYYKPYSLFREQLSHISEEDASMLQRMATTNNSVSIKPLPRQTSFCSASLLSHATTTATTPDNIMSNSQALINPSPLCVSSAVEYEDSACYFQCTVTKSSSQYLQTNTHQLIESETPPSFELARLPYPPPQAPAVVLITLLPGYYEKHYPYHSLIEDGYCHQCNFPAQHSCHYQQSRWLLKSFVSSVFFLGVMFGMTQPLLYLYLHDTLGLPMHMVGITGLSMVAADFLAGCLVIKIIQRFQLSTITASAHLVLILCALGYTCLQPNGLIVTKFAALALQCLLGLSLHSIWLLAAHQVDSVILIGHKRIMLKGAMAAVFSGLGPAIGVLLSGYLVGYQPQSEALILEKYHHLYQYAAGLAMISGILSWEWSTSN